MMLGRIGTACQWLAPDGTVDPRFRFHDLSRQNYRRFGPARLRDIAFHNARVLHAVVCHLGQGPMRDRMFRIGNHVLPCLTLPEARRTWADPGFLRDLRHAYAAVGRRARNDRVRLSTHPSQFIIPNSVHADVRERSVLELDAWAEWASLMSDDSFCMNIHLGPRLDGTEETLHASWRVARKMMSRRAWRVLTVENDDKVWTGGHLVRAARVADFRPVLDVHHHWSVTGKWPDPLAVGASIVPLWRGERPKVHLSIPRGRYYRTSDGLDGAGMPVLRGGHARVNEDGSADRYNPLAHGYMPWAPGMPRYVLGLLRHVDLVCEIKGKNLARDALWTGIEELRESRT